MKLGNLCQVPEPSFDSGVDLCFFLLVSITGRMEEDGYVLVGLNNTQDGSMESSAKYLADINDFIEKISDELWTVNKSIHDNPELGYEEHKAHALLTSFLKRRKGWKVTPSAYGMDTAWVAVYDSGEKGPVVSLNVEMGASIFPIAVHRRTPSLTDLEQMPCPAWDMHADIT